MTSIYHANEFIRVFFRVEAEDIIARLASKYAAIKKEVAFAKQSKNPLDEKMDYMAYLLSFCLVLESRGHDLYDVREFMLSMTDYVNEKQPGSKFWRRKQLMRLLNTAVAEIAMPKVEAKISKQGHPLGTSGTVVEGLNETFGMGFGIDIHNCGICGLLERTNTKRFADFFCEADKIFMGMPGFKVILKDSIIYEGDKCQFRFKPI